MPPDLLHFNGVNGDTGSYDLPPMTADELVQVIRGEIKPENLEELRFRVRQATTGVLGLRDDLDPKNLAEAGWGIIFPTYKASEPEKRKRVDAIREALQPLLTLRNKSTDGHFEEWVQGTEKGFRVDTDTKNSYLSRHGAGPGPADPSKVPYYLLIAGSPIDIPYRFQSQLDVQYAVGRIHFETLQEYADYAASVVAMETGRKRLKRQAAFFGTANSDDLATQMSSTQLVAPVAGWLKKSHKDWGIQTIAPAEATKATLGSLLGGDQTPSLLFSATHGMKFDKGKPRQVPHQGALLCQDWPGPQQWTTAIPQDFYFAGDDLAASADLLGLIAFFFACYGGGTPQFNEFARQDSLGSTTPTRKEIAAQPFLAGLPTKMLGRPRGALAVVGHVERAWSYSFNWGKAGIQTAVFESMLNRLLEGHPLGSAVEYMNERYAELSTVLSDELEEIEFGKRFDPFEIAGLWTSNNDARGYAIIGDPAVRLPIVEGDEQPVERAVIKIKTTTVKESTTTITASTPEAASASLTEDTTAPHPGVALSVSATGSAARVRTYVSENLENPPEADLRIITRQSADGALEIVVHPDVAQNAGLLALHQALAERNGKA